MDLGIKLRMYAYDSFFLLKKLVFIFLFSLFECDISTSKHGLHEQIVAANRQEPHDVLGMPVSLKASKGGAASSPHLCGLAVVDKLERCRCAMCVKSPADRW